MARLKLQETKLQEKLEEEAEKLPDYLTKLVGGFAFRVYWFEIFECFRKLMLVCAPVFFDPPGSSSQLVFGLMVCFTVFGNFSYWRPYKEDNALALLCQIQIFFSLLAAVVNSFDEASIRQNSNMDVLLVVLTLLPIVLAMLKATFTNMWRIICA